MSVKAKIHLSKFEMDLVNNTDWILTKQSILTKVYLLFGEMLETYKRISKNEQDNLSVLDLTKNGKISKGENYLGLPYIMLDYPAIFKKDKILAIRTMFWWGNFFSITLHVSGESILQKIFVSNILEHLNGADFFVCIGENEWQHSFDSSNYIPINDIDAIQHAAICSKRFFKISKKIELNKWEEVQQFLEESYKEIIEIIKIPNHFGVKTASDV